MENEQTIEALRLISAELKSLRAEMSDGFRGVNLTNIEQNERLTQLEKRFTKFEKARELASPLGEERGDSCTRPPRKADA